MAERGLVKVALSVTTLDRKLARAMEPRASTPDKRLESVQLLVTWFTAIHLLLAAFVGVLVGGRILRGRLAGHEFIAEVTGYWWYYTVVASVLLWLFGVYLT